MAEWQTVAEGAHFWDIKQLVADRELPKGTKIRVVLDTPGFDWLFDMVGAELVFLPVVPKGMDLVDVWGENGQGIVEMEADPAHLGAIILGLPVWAWLLLGLFTLAAIVAFIVVMVKVPAIAQIPFWLVIGAAAGIVGLVLISERKPAIIKKLKERRKI